LQRVCTTRVLEVYFILPVQLGVSQLQLPGSVPPPPAYNESQGHTHTHTQESEVCNTRTNTVTEDA